MPLPCACLSYLVLFWEVRAEVRGLAGTPTVKPVTNANANDAASALLPQSDNSLGRTARRLAEFIQGRCTRDRFDGGA